YPSQNTYRRNASAQVEVGRDTAGHPQYQTVYATVNVTRSSFTARADMDINIAEVSTGKNISYRNVRDDYRWEEETPNYSGDSRPLPTAGLSFNDGKRSYTLHSQYIKYQ